MPRPFACPGGRSAGSPVQELGEEVADTTVDVIADGADGFEWLVDGVVDVPVEVPLAGIERAGVAAAHGDDDVCGARDLVGERRSPGTVIMFGVLGWFYLQVLPGWLGLDTAALDVNAWTIAKSVLIFLGIPLLAGYLSRRLGEKAKGRQWYEARFLPKVGPVALYGLLFTIVVLFALQGHTITARPLDVARIALPLLAYFAIMWAGAYTLGKAIGLNYARTTTLAFTAAGNNFELAIAVAIGVFGVTSGKALAGAVGPRSRNRESSG
jgi:ACR3 family arsenite transporter